jgi:hypothetical protein
MGGAWPEISRPDPARNIFNRTFPEKILNGSSLKKIQANPPLKISHDPNITKNLLTPS